MLRAFCVLVLVSACGSITPAAGVDAAGSAGAAAGAGATAGAAGTGGAGGTTAAPGAGGASSGGTTGAAGVSGQSGDAGATCRQQAVVGMCGFGYVMGLPCANCATQTGVPIVDCVGTFGATGEAYCVASCSNDPRCVPGN